MESGIIGARSVRLVYALLPTESSLLPWQANITTRRKNQRNSHYLPFNPHKIMQFSIWFFLLVLRTTVWH